MKPMRFEYALFQMVVGFAPLATLCFLSFAGFLKVRLRHFWPGMALALVPWAIC